MKYIIIGIVLVLLGIGGYFYTQMGSETVVNNDTTTPDVNEDTTQPDTSDPVDEDDEDNQSRGDSTTIGTSVDGNEITAYHYGSGSTELLFVGGTHGGYSWNTILLGYELMDHLEENPEVIPDNVTVTVIPVFNPDGLDTVIGSTGRFAASAMPSSVSATIPGRFNGRDVDLNRNFDCEWQSSGTWQNQTVSGGSAAFSEPETQALRDYVAQYDPTAAVVYYSAAGGVYASNCGEGVMAETSELTNLYADASGYPAYEEFDYYEITGDMVNWMAKENIPAISVLLTNHTDVEWNKNRAGIEAVLQNYAN